MTTPAAQALQSFAAELRATARAGLATPLYPMADADARLLHGVSAALVAAAVRTGALFARADRAGDVRLFAPAA